MKEIDPEMLRLIAETHGYASIEWTRSIPIPDDNDFPVLELPEGKLEYSTERAYPMKFEPRRFGDRFLLFVAVESFAITEGGGNWATAGKYTPESDEERIIHELGFDEGWELAQLESIFICDQRFSVFWRAVRERKRFGLTAPQGGSLYPVSLAKDELGPLGKILSKWSN